MGKKFGEMTKTERIDALKDILYSYGSISLQYMMNEFRISRKTALRDLDELGNLGIETVDEALENGDRRISASFGSRKIPVTFTLEQVMALFLGRQMFDFLESTPFEQAFTEVYAQIERRLAKKTDIDNVKKLSKKLYMVHEGPKKFKPEITAMLGTCITGLRHEKALMIDYANFRGEPSSFIMRPYTLVAYKRGLYLVGSIDEYDGQIRKLAVERIQNVQLTGIPVTIPDDYTPQDYFKDALFIDGGAPQRVELLFAAGADAFIGLRVFHPSQTLKKKKDGTILLTMDVHVGFEVLNWIL